MIIISAWALRYLFCWERFARPEIVEHSDESELHAFFHSLLFFLQKGVVAACNILKDSEHNNSLPGIG